MALTGRLGKVPLTEDTSLPSSLEEDTEIFRTGAFLALPTGILRDAATPRPFVPL